MYEIVIGLEVHAQLLTASKLFCGDATVFGAPPNTAVSAISLGHPGTLPRLNEKALHHAVLLGLALGCNISRQHYFARKHYFYPDLPKGFQTTQHTAPICVGGGLEVPVEGNPRFINLNRIHMEEDAGKTSQPAGTEFSAIDYNRAGMPLVEIVTEPCLRSSQEAMAFVKALRALVRRLGICDGNMEEGSFRCDVNISVRPEGDIRLGTRVEIKNLNSIRFIGKAIEYESERLIRMHREGKAIRQETRGFNEEDGSTYSIRVKENEDDYRYLAEPDLPLFVVSESMIDTLRAQLPPSPVEVKENLQQHYGLGEQDAAMLSQDGELTVVFREMVAHTIHIKAAANWTLGPIRQLLSGSEAFEASAVFYRNCAKLIDLVEEGRVAHRVAITKVLLQLCQLPETDPLTFIEEHNLAIGADEGQVDAWIDAVLEKHSQKIVEYKKGRKGLLSLFVGEVLKLSKGKADASQVNERLLRKLNTIE